jgi:laminin, alpha 1/2
VIGYYGNATHGTVDDCKKCACPMTDESNNFSQTCILDANEVLGYKCDNCPQGHTGSYCEKCLDGFYGDPMKKGSRCSLCKCNQDEACHPETGECVKCSGNTEGWKCDRCKSGFYGDPSDGCKACECSSPGALDNFCDQVSGKCACKENYAGHVCDQCNTGFANISLNCAPCECNLQGSNSEMCDHVTGQCLCKINVIGLKCDLCDELYFGMDDSGCKGNM